MDSCAVCLYQELRGIIVRGIPDENSVLKRLNVNGIDNLVNDFFNINKGGVVAAFWGVDLLDYARIYD
ncbi:hypothetical protein GOV03_03395, partial [Candidatus Woesearchaeota archaeon]|nr:hypothetical protein [Candidatus Woesearchaeota archaeon]